ncbi:hypothetical protein AVEN_95598-1 [Araneus ventricosus]|uniref:Uncharacterized protein n=1 Tax=Araneus ventricosus TaxID=182803 RepID=A0A4Y2FYQ2_ARAVE|nr:hypothetical protein AVEN_95598-1 [Araneus ventricosus]
MVDHRSIPDTLIILLIVGNLSYKGSDDYSTNDNIPESTPVVKPQEPVAEPVSDSQFSPESSSHEPSSRSPDKPYQTRYGRVVRPPSRYVAKF